jgi:succinate dehydrogenase hydrophobic anchor subunit
MSANSAAHGTKHFKMHSLAGWGVIIGLPFAAIFAVLAVQGGAHGVKMWLSSPHGALGLIAFLSAAILYCKLEMDEVIMDYFSGGLRSFGQLANTLAATILWVASVAGLVLAAFV